MDYSLLKPGDVIETPKGRIKLTETPHYNEGWGCWYAFGHKWMKSKQKFSGNALLHNFKAGTAKKSS